MKKGKSLSVTQGQLPIFRFVVVNGVTYRRRLDYGDKIKCKICGMEFDLDEETSFIERGLQTPFIKCPHCERLVQAVKYMKD